MILIYKSLSFHTYHLEKFGINNFQLSPGKFYNLALCKFAQLTANAFARATDKIGQFRYGKGKFKSG